MSGGRWEWMGVDGSGWGLVRLGGSELEWVGLSGVDGRGLE